MKKHFINNNYSKLPWVVIFKVSSLNHFEFQKVYFHSCICLLCSISNCRIQLTTVWLLLRISFFLPCLWVSSIATCTDGRIRSVINLIAGQSFQHLAQLCDFEHLRLFFSLTNTVKQISLFVVIIGRIDHGHWCWLRVSWCCVWRSTRIWSIFLSRSRIWFSILASLENTVVLSLSLVKTWSGFPNVVSSLNRKKRKTNAWNLSIPTNY